MCGCVRECVFGAWVIYGGVERARECTRVSIAANKKRWIRRVFGMRAHEECVERACFSSADMGMGMGRRYVNTTSSLKICFDMNLGKITCP